MQGKKSDKIKDESEVMAENLFAQGLFFESQGEALKAVDFFYRSLLLPPQKDAYWASFAHSIRFLEFPVVDETLRETIIQCFSKRNVLNYQNLAIPGQSILKHSKDYAKLLDEAKTTSSHELWTRFWNSQISKDPLFLAVLQYCIIPHENFEVFCTKLRKQLCTELAQGASHEEKLTFTCALAAHCFLTEYVYRESEEEKKQIIEIEKQLKDLKGLSPKHEIHKIGRAHV